MYGSLIPEMPDLCSSISTCCGDITAPEGDSTPSVVNNNDWNTCMHTTKSNYSLPMFLVSKMPSIDEDIIATTSNGTTSLWWDKLSNKAGDLGDKLSDGVNCFGDSLGTYASNATGKLYAGVDKLGDRLGAFANNATDQLSNKALEEFNKHRAAANRLTQKAKIGIAIGTLVALMMLFTFCCCCVKRRRGVSKQFIASSKPRFSYDDPIPTGNAATSKKKGAKYSEPLVATEPIVKLERPWTSMSFLKVKGQIAYPNGDMYDGELLDGKPHGVGVFHSPGLKYEGEWKNGLKHGKGVLKYHNGDQLVGEWKEGKKIGQGQYAFDSTLAQLW